MVRRLLLVAALVLGVAAMHSFGHPMAPTGTMTATRSMTATTPMTSMSPMTPMTSTAVTAHASSVTGHQDVGRTADAAHGSRSLPAMDPMDVCLAVLGSWAVALLLLLGVAVLRRPGVLAAARALRLGRVRWPQPPPLSTALVRQSVLRI
ncbi:hypothetical protein K7472_15725 [Streptomyces sp. PTM05]|uniref:Uncharacterized protein n=1 Tax=Streptantibioticus parmotrematis TaxID=2873249 RepID=A0ABS7QSY2_9ACTN|nr:hypothetical protein [Streptantibioticus parmotrematis]MBY8886303.1 hypothetical protein [Streptantibioticus parmotrematis]